jgi:hypothetical protein
MPDLVEERSKIFDYQLPQNIDSRFAIESLFMPEATPQTFAISLIPVEKLSSQYSAS